METPSQGPLSPGRSAAPARAELPAPEATALARVGPTPFPTFWDLWGRGSGRPPETPWTGPPVCSGHNGPPSCPRGWTHRSLPLFS